jgi:hypothetical protein
MKEPFNGQSGDELYRLVYVYACMMYVCMYMHTHISDRAATSSTGSYVYAYM